MNGGLSMRVLNGKQMLEAERRTIEEIGIPAIVLMENAGRQVVAALEARFDDLAQRRVAILCGCGNNGGDGFVVARTLQQRDILASVFLVGEVANVKDEARRNLEVLGRLGMTVVEIRDEQAWELHYSEISDYDIIVDALLGTGVRVPLVGLLQTLVADINVSNIPVVSVDLPTGVSADSHDIVGEVMEASLTVTMAVPKIPLILPPAESQAGDLVVADIGIPQEVIDNVEPPKIDLLTRETILELVNPRHDDAHKGDFGHVLIVAGSNGKSGAASLAGIGSIRSGAGLVTVASPKSCQGIIAAAAPDYMTESLAETPEGLVDFAALEAVLRMKNDVIAVGPGLGIGPSVSAFVHGLLERVGTPIILDADALNAFVGDVDRLHGRDGLDVVITPHPGEMARLLGTTVDDVQANRVEIARQFAMAHHLHVVLKGYRTVIATPTGAVFLNLTGNPGMAVGGTGDVLTGVIAAWSAQLLDADAACKVAVYVHGMAGDIAEVDKGEISMSASDLTDHLGTALLDLSSSNQIEDESQGNQN